MNVKLTQWNKSGDSQLVSNKTDIKEFEYVEAMSNGYGFINNTIVYPGDYIVEINNIFTAVVSKEKGKELLNSRLKYVKVMPEYSSSGLWNKDGLMINFSDLDIIDEAIYKSLTNWLNKWEDFEWNYDINSNKLKDKNYIEKKTLLEIEGEKIAAYILNERPDLIVEFTYDGEKLKKITEPESLWKKLSRK